MLAPKFWYHRNFLSLSLLPLAVCYFVVITIRKLFYNILGKLRGRDRQLTVPIIVVGNITVGGSGKTPLVIWLAEFLSLHGYKPGIISRGYGGKSKVYPMTVDGDSDPTVVGDEPLLISLRTSCPMVVDPNRVRAVKHLLATNGEVNVVISDDGLQHYPLPRDIEIAVIEAHAELGNGFLFPAGPLREPRTRLCSVDAIVMNGIKDNCLLRHCDEHVIARSTSLRGAHSATRQSRNIQYQPAIQKNPTTRGNPEKPYNPRRSRKTQYQPAIQKNSNPLCSLYLENYIKCKILKIP